MIRSIGRDRARRRQTDTAVQDGDCVRACRHASAPRRAVAVDLAGRRGRLGARSPDCSRVEPAARFGRPARFRLRARPDDRVRASACVHVTMPHLRVMRPLRRGRRRSRPGTFVNGRRRSRSRCRSSRCRAAAAVVGSTSVRALPADEVVTTRDRPASRRRFAAATSCDDAYRRRRCRGRRSGDGAAIRQRGRRHPAGERAESPSASRTHYRQGDSRGAA